jgi:hypothetical protein
MKKNKYLLFGLLLLVGIPMIIVNCQRIKQALQQSIKLQQTACDYYFNMYQP